MANKQAREASKRADDIIKNLANPSEAIETEQSTVKVLDKAQPVAPVETGNWESRFKGYKSSTDKTLHTLRQKVNQFDLMNSENERLKEQLETTQAKVPTTPDEMLELFSQAEVDGFNKMFGDKVEVLQGKVTTLEKELQSVHKKEMEGLAQQTHQDIISQVAQAVPDYKSIDNDPAFSDYMKAVDSYGNVRFDLLMRAKHSTPPDISRIVQFYVDFAGETAAAVTAQEEQPKQYTQQELLQNPSSASSDTPASPQGLGIVWDQPTISQFYKDRAIGKIDPERAKELEADMYASRRG